MDIRFAGIDDADALIELDTEVHSLHVQKLPTIFKPISDSKLLREVIEKALENNDVYIIIAIEDNHAIGYVLAAYQHYPETLHKYSQSVLYIHNLVVAEKKRSQGVGTKLIHRTKKLASEIGADYLELNVWAFNKIAHRFFIGQGFNFLTERLRFEPTND